MEFAITLPFFLLLVSGVVDYGTYFLTVAKTSHSIQRGGSVAASIKESPHHPFGEEVLASARAQTLRAMEENGVLSADESVVQAEIYQSHMWGVNMLRIDLTVPFRPIVGLLPTPNQIEKSFVIGIRAQGEQP